MSNLLLRGGWNAKSQNLILEYSKLSLEVNPDNHYTLVNDIGIDNTFILILSLVTESGEKYGDKLTLSYMLSLYKSGINFSEIAWLKGITEDGVRYNIHNLVNGVDKSALKYEHLENRKSLKKEIFRYEILPLIDELGYDNTRKLLRYKESYFKRFVSKLEK